LPFVLLKVHFMPAVGRQVPGVFLPPAADGSEIIPVNLIRVMPAQGRIVFISFLTAFPSLFIHQQHL